MKLKDNTEIDDNSDPVKSILEGCLRLVVMSIVLSPFVSVAIIWIYGNSPNYCRDCNTGLGLCFFGYIFSIPIAMIIMLISKLFSRQSSKRKNEVSTRKTRFD